MKEKCPCKACLCVAVCRHKPYSQLFDNCQLVTEYLPYHVFCIKRDDSKLSYIAKALEPTEWRLEETKVDNMFYFLIINEKVEEFRTESEVQLCQWPSKNNIE